MTILSFWAEFREARAKAVGFDISVSSVRSTHPVCLQNRRPIVWAEGGYAEKLGLPPVAQGTGMTTQEAQAFRIKDLGLFREYVKKVWASTDEYLAKIDPATLDATVTIKPLGDMPAIRALAQVCVGHGFTHVGEIELAKTLVG